MDIRKVSEEEKKEVIDNVKGVFNDLRSVLKTLEEDMESTDLQTQATSCWISGQLCHWYSDFVTEIKKIDSTMKTMENLKEEIKNVVSENPSSIN